LIVIVTGKVGVVDRTSEDGAEEWRSPLVDVSGVTPGELADRAGDTTLAYSLRRLADELSDPGEPIAGFNSAL
jgi:FXSXX-COOH protein